jgi:nitroreductase
LIDFFTAVDTQRALRRFRADPVPDDVVRRVLAAATRAPSARGAEPWFFLVVRDAALRGWIEERYCAAWAAAADYTATVDADRDLRDRPHYARMMRAAAELAAHLAAAPVHVVCCLDHRQLGPLVAPDGTLRSPAAAYASIFPAVQNLLLAARALGLGSTLTTLHTAFADALKAQLAIPRPVEVVALVPLGYPADRFGPTRRKPVDEIAFLDRWGTPLP